MFPMPIKPIELNRERERERDRETESKRNRDRATRGNSRESERRGCCWDRRAQRSHSLHDDKWEIVLCQRWAEHYYITESVLCQRLAEHYYITESVLCQRWAEHYYITESVSKFQTTWKLLGNQDSNVLAEFFHFKLLMRTSNHWHVKVGHKPKNKNTVKQWAKAVETFYLP